MRSLIGEKADPVTIPQWLSPSIHDGTGYRSKWVPILSVGAGEEDDAGRRRLRRPSFEVPHHTNGRRKRPYKSSMLFTRKTAIVQHQTATQSPIMDGSESASALDTGHGIVRTCGHTPPHFAAAARYVR